MRRHRPGPRPYPRLRTNPEFVAAVRASRLPYGPLARACGCREGHFSYLLNAVLIPASPQNVAALLRAADAVQFPRDRAFLDPVPAVATVPAFVPPTDADRATDALERARNRVARLEAELRQLQTSQNELVTRS